MTESVDYTSMVGAKVTKFREGQEPKPFKSGQKVNTVKGVINHPQLNIPAFTFEEDDSYVECRRCSPVRGWIDNVLESGTQTLTETAYEEPRCILTPTVTAEPMVTYAHVNDPKGTRFLSFAADKLPAWAVDVRPHVVQEPLLDAAGQALAFGDRVAFIPQDGYTGGLSLGVIEGFTKKKVRIRVTNKVWRYSDDTCLKFPEQCVKV